MRSRLRNSIGTKIFAAFFAMSAIIGVLGAYGYGVLSSAGDMVTGTYDGPMMAINYARAASVDFVQMQQMVLRRELTPHNKRATFDAKVDNLTSTFFDDLDVAEQRLGADDERLIVRQIRTLVKSWETTWKTSERAGNDPDLDALDARIMDRFDMLIELNTDHSFVGRRKAVWSVGYFKYALIAVTGLAMLLAFGITLFLARRIMRPLSAAVAAADHIASGEFETVIPQAGQDETGVLLNSMTVMQSNIREMMAREKERAESAEARLTNALETSSEGVILVDHNGRVLLANNIMRDFFPSVGASLVTGAEFKTLSLVAQQDLIEPFDVPSPGLPGFGKGARVLGSEERQLKDGRWIRSTASRTDDGGLMFFVSDFTALKEREENFRRAQQAAEAASAAKTRFLNNMSHELRTPLNAIIGFSEMLTSQIFGALGHARYSEYASDIQKSGRHLLEIINSVLEISRGGNEALQSAPTDLNALLGRCADAVAEQCRDAKVALRYEQPEIAIVVPGEPEKLQQVFKNVLSNAVKFSAPGGAVTLRLERDAGRAVVEIEDTGVGMSSEGINIALTPFGQVDSRLARKYEGTGLGLPLAKSLVELHGGTLSIESELQKGTIVRVSLPDAHTGEFTLPTAKAS